MQGMTTKYKSAILIVMNMVNYKIFIFTLKIKNEKF